MIKELEKLLKNAYSPYSQIKVASIVVDKNKRTYQGVNVENASYGATRCAEQSALLSGISQGVQKGDFIELHLTSNAPKILYPCGICRQVMSELLSSKAKIFIYFEGKVEKTTILNLMPNVVLKESFGWK